MPISFIAATVADNSSAQPDALHTPNVHIPLVMLSPPSHVVRSPPTLGDGTISKEMEEHSSKRTILQRKVSSPATKLSRQPPCPQNCKAASLSRFPDVQLLVLDRSVILLNHIYLQLDGTSQRATSSNDRLSSIASRLDQLSLVFLLFARLRHRALPRPDDAVRIRTRTQEAHTRAAGTPRTIGPRPEAT